MYMPTKLDKCMKSEMYVNNEMMKIYFTFILLLGDMRNKYTSHIE